MSFINIPSKNLLDRLTQILIKVITIEGGLQLKRANRQQSVKVVYQYIRQVNYFLELLLCSMYVILGQPSCRSKITTIQYYNSILQDHNIFVTNRQIITIVCYYKLQLQQNKLKIILYFLLLQLGQVIAIYLVYIQLF